MITEECDLNDQVKSLVIFGRDNNELETSYLYFCGHHANENIVELRRAGWIIIADERTFKIEDPRGTATRTPVIRSQPGSAPTDDDGTSGVTADV